MKPSIAHGLQVMKKMHGLSDRELADLLGVCWLTIWKWRHGHTHAERSPEIRKWILEWSALGIAIQEAEIEERLARKNHRKPFTGRRRICRIPRMEKAPANAKTTE